MQATVRSFDAPTLTGTVLLDNGIELPYDAAAFEPARLRSLRIGQRVNVRLDADEVRVATLSLATQPLA